MTNFSPDEERNLRDLKDLVQKGQINEEDSKRNLPRERFKELAQKTIEAQREAEGYLEDYDARNGSHLTQKWRIMTKIGMYALEPTSKDGRTFFEIDGGNSSFEQKVTEKNRGGLLVASVLFPHELGKDVETAGLSVDILTQMIQRLGFLDPNDPNEKSNIERLLNGEISDLQSLLQTPGYGKLFHYLEMTTTILHIQHPSEPFSIRAGLNTLYPAEPRLDTSEAIRAYNTTLGKKCAVSGFGIYYHDPNFTTK